MAGVNLNKLIAETGKRLQAVGIEAGAAEAELVLCDLLDFNRLQLYLNGPSMFDDSLLKKFNHIIEKRLTRYPLQYILGSAWFYGRKFLVNEDVMVPCPETELLLESALRATGFCRSDPVRLLDIGVGSGVVAISAKLENEGLDVTATDISEDALHVAQVNAERLGLKGEIRFIKSNLFEAIDKSVKFDIIVSNPPYISDSEYEEVEPEVKADPTQALLAGPKGLDIINPLISTAPEFLTRPGYLMFEIGFNQAQDIFALVQNDGRYSECSLLKDLSDIDRIIICKIA